jgi:hypothetical protein
LLTVSYRKTAQKYTEHWMWVWHDLDLVVSDVD